MWQIAMTYVTIVGAAILAVADKKQELLRLILCSVAAISICVFIQTIWLRKGDRRAVRNIQHYERELGVHPTAEYHPVATLPLLILVGLFVLISTITAAWMWI